MQCSETQLIEEIKKHNAGTFDFLIQEYTKPVYYLVYNILNSGGTKEDIEECVSDVFLEVWQKIKDYDGKKGSFRTWILMLAKYKALAYRRKNGKNNTVDIEDYMLEDQMCIENKVIDRQVQETIIETIGAFGRVDRELFIRRYFFGESIAALMASLDLSRSAIDNRLLRGRKLLKEVLSDD